MRRSDTRLGFFFWVGVALITAGVGLHAREYLAMRHMRYEMVGMPPSVAMYAGMLIIVIGLAIAARALFTRAPTAAGTPRAARFEAERLAPIQVGLVVVAVAALAIDAMKPATIAFVLPGLREEYGLTRPEASALPLVALTGTVIGSVVWGAAADRFGRRPAVLLSALLFIATSVCGAMPSFAGNLVMCLVMGGSVGGLLPVVLTLLAEIVPRRQRAFAVVLVATLGGTGGYLLASGAASLLEQSYSWRMLWLIGAPTGLLVALLQRLVPESPRFLLLHGRDVEAARVMERFSLRAVYDGAPQASPATARVASSALLGGRYRLVTLALSAYAFSWGLVNFGFLTWLPTIFADVASLSSAGAVNDLLATAALAALPGSLVVAWLYSHWSSKGSLVGSAVVAAGGLVVVGFLDAGEAGRGAIATALVVLIASVNAMNAMLLPYAAELYPTEMRGRATGLVAGGGKLGGIVGVLVVSGLLVLNGGPQLPAIALAVPLGLSVALLACFTVETKGRDLAERTLAAEATS